MPIAVAPAGRKMKVVKVTADDKTRRHLENLGITVGAQITVLSAGGGSVIVMVKDSRLALDKSVATKILVAI